MPKNLMAIQFMLTNLGSKGLAAIAQLYAIFVFTRMHTQDEAALIFLLLGYAIWFQVFEFGLGQTLQNKFNAKQICADDMLITSVVHYGCMLVIAIIVATTPFLTELLLPTSRSNASLEDAKAFSIGAAILLMASNNVITQRLLLVLNKGQLGNILIMCQSVLAVLGLACYEAVDHPNLIVAVLLYLGPQIIVFFPILLGQIIRLVGNPTKKKRDKAPNIFYDSLGFAGLGVLSAVFLGADYYFAAHYLSSEQVVSYHLVTRLFFISFVAYYAYIQHRTRRLSLLALDGGVNVVSSIFRDSAFIGLGSVLTVYASAFLLDQFGAFDSMTNGRGIDHGLLLSGFLYFMVRVCRDVGLVVAGGLNARVVIYKVYALEVLVGLSLMYIIAPTYGGRGIFSSLTLASILGLALLLQQARQLGITHTQKH